MALPEKYKGKSFAEIADEIKKKYKNRYDPISMRGLRSEIEQLQNEQEYQKQVQAIEEANAAVLDGEAQVMSQPNSQPTSSQGVDFVPPQNNPSVDITQEDSGTFNRAASSTYNSKFANGGEMNNGDPINKTEQYISSLPLEERKLLYDKYMMVKNPITGKEQTYGSFRESMLTSNREQLRKYLSDKRLDASPEEYVRSIFKQSKGKFIKSNPDKLPVPESFQQEIERKIKERVSSQDTKTSLMDKKISSFNKPSQEKGKKIIDYNKDISKQANQRVQQDIEQGLRDENGDLYIKENADGGFLSNNSGSIGTALKLAPMIGNAIQLATNKKPDPVPRRLIDLSFLKKLERFKPRESRFKNIDLNNIERGIIESSGRFTQSNKETSGGNAGSFIANELANQSNLYRSIGDARMKAQIADRETAKLNAGEKARVDSLKAGLLGQSSQLELQGRSFNERAKMQADIMDDQNLAAYNDAQSALWNNIYQGLGNLGDMFIGNQMSQNRYGYDIFGNYTGGGGSSYTTGPTGGAPVPKAYGGFINKIRKIRR